MPPALRRATLILDYSSFLRYILDCSTIEYTNISTEPGRSPDMSAVQTEATTLVPAGTWTVDPVYSSIRWDVIDLDAGMKSIAGRFTEFEGTVEGGEEQAAKGVVATASVLTDHELRDGHLRSGDMLDTDRFPEIRFESSRIEQVEGNRHKIVGELTIKDVP